MAKLKNIIAICTIAFLLVPELSAQGLTTANSLFSKIAEKYGSFGDYRAAISISNEDPADATKKQTMEGVLYWKKKSRLRIDFSKPYNSVLVSSGLLMQVYLDAQNIILTQKLDPNKANPTGLATTEGLTMMRRGYNIAFKTGPELQPLEAGSKEMVYKFVLTWKNANQGFRQIELSVTDGFLIRRIDAIAADRHRIVMSFTGISPNIGIGDARFQFDPPAGANQYDGFMFGTGN